MGSRKSAFLITPGSVLRTVMRIVPNDRNNPLRRIRQAGWWWHMPLMPVLGRLKQADLCKFEASLVHSVIGVISRLA